MMIALTGLFAAVVLVNERILADRTYEFVEKEHAINLEEVSNKVQERIGIYQQDMLFLYATPPISGLARASANNGLDAQDETTYQQWQSRLSTIFTAFLQNSPDVQSLSIVLASGQELLRAERSPGLVQMAKSRQLKDFTPSPEFSSLEALSEGDNYISQIVPATRRGQIVYPVEPRLNLAKPIFHDDGRLYGFLYVSINIGPLLNSLHQLVNDYDEVIISDSNNIIIYHSQSEYSYSGVTPFGLAFETLYPDRRPVERGLQLLTSKDNQINYLSSSRLIRQGMEGRQLSLNVTLLSNKAMLDSMATEEKALFYSVLGIVIVLMGSVILNMMRTTQRKAALAETRAEAQALFDVSTDGIVFVDPDGNIASCNREFIEQCELPEFKVKGQPFNKVLAHRLAPEQVEQLIQFESNELNDDIVVNWTSRNATRKVFSCSTHLIMATRRASRYALVFSDITAQQEARQQIMQVNNQLEEKIAERTMQLEAAHQDALRSSDIKSKFISNISHEMRTPLNGIIGSLSMLGRRLHEPESLRFLSMAETSATNLNVLINDILDMSKIEAGKLEIEDKPFSPLKLIESLVSSQAVRAQEKGLGMYLDTSALSVVSFTSDPHRLTQVINNLLSNAIKFTNDGHILVSIRSMLDEPAQMRLEVTVADTGVGIAEDNQDKLFASFSQADKSIAAKYGGTGLGLAICKQLCQLMNGDISLSSDHGKGTAVTFYVTSGQWQSDSPESVKRLQGKTVARFISDQAEQQVVDNLLSRLGATLYGEESPADIDWDADSAPHIILIDAHSMDFRELILHWPYEADSVPQIVLFRHPGKPVLAHELSDVMCINQPVLRSELLSRLFDERKETGDGINATRRITDQPVTSETDLQLQLDDRYIVLVDDNDINLEVAASFLAPYAQQIARATDGIKAIELLSTMADERKPVAAVLMDCNMPNMDGYEATRRIRDGKAGQKLADVPIIAMTANAMRGEREKCLHAGMNDYITKPIDGNILASKLAHWTVAGRSVSTDQFAGPGDIARLTEDADTSSVQSPIFDCEGALRRLMNNDALLKKLATMFVENSPAKMNSLRLACDKKDAEQARLASHALKGQSGDIGLQVLYDKLVKMEQGAREKQVESFAGLLEAVLQAHRDAIEALTAYTTQRS
ncbi:ATP-binding protein [Salinimonas lutimaris]|uniref:ATP-binding protein n=1 Tax=Salinimonas lutimaris TaxID=914153 RepID=UPI001C30E89F|nr:ATP-binding protein [Salinimonas lutimaris]